MAVAVVGLAVGSACSSSDDQPGKPSETAGTSSSDAGAAGAAAGRDNAGAAGTDNAGAGGVDNAGAAGADNAGAAGADPCAARFYSCPLVIYWSHATIKVDLPVAAADAAAARFTACRNDECHSAKGSATIDPGWVYTKEGGTVFLSFDDSGTTPFATLHWTFTYDGPPPSNASDHYSLTIQPAAAAAPTTLFDGQVQYAIESVEPSSEFGNFCSHCFDVSAATVDARAGH